MGEHQETSRINENEDTREDTGYFGEFINNFYNLGIQCGISLFEMYKMDLIELEQVVINRRKGIADNLYRLACLTRHPMVDNFPETPQDAFPDMYPPKPTIPMPDFLIEKAIKRGVL